jgi:DNA-binding response OmpR family regulator
MGLERLAGLRPAAVSLSGGFAPPSARVLVVEDFPQLRALLMDGLARAGFAVDGAGSVREPLDLTLEAYDALVVDRRLGDALGTDLFRILAARDETVASRFILMTAEGHALDLPAEVPVLLEPFRISALVDVVRRIHGGRATPQEDAQSAGS